MGTGDIFIQSTNVELSEKESVAFDKKTRVFLENELSPSEERISKPMDEGCECSVIVPAYAERVGLFSRTLLSLSKQEGVNPDKFEVICIINNGEHDSETVKEENEATLSMLRYIQIGNEVDLPESITNEEKEILDQIRKSNIRVYAVDKSTGGKAFGDQEANVGSARQRGLAEAVERFSNIRRNGIISHTDGDTRQDSRYISSLIEAFNDPDVIGITGKLEMELEETGSELFNEEMRKKMYEAQDRRREYYLKLTEIYPESEVVKQTPDAEQNLAFNGCNMASRVSAAVEVGGIDKLPGEEDTRFGRRLKELGKIIYAPEVVVSSQMRLSERTTTGHGVELGRTVEQINKHGDFLVEHPGKIGFMEDLRNKIDTALQKGSLTKDDLTEWLNIQGDLLLASNKIDEFFDLLKTCKRLGDLKPNDTKVTSLAASLNSALLVHFPKLTTFEALRELNKIIQRSL